MSVYEVENYGCVKNTRVYGLDESIRRAKYPMAVNLNELTEDLTKGISALAKSGHGEGHDQWLTGVVVQCDLTFSNKAWVEMERYHFLDFVSSQSTMHRLEKFNLRAAYNKYVDEDIVLIMEEKVVAYNQMVKMIEESQLNEEQRKKAAELLEVLKLQLLYSNPAGFELTAGITTNYRQLKTIYQQRRNHRLPEWKEFCRWIETLPSSDLITQKRGEAYSDEN